MTTKTLSKNDFAHFTGSESCYRHGITATFFIPTARAACCRAGGAHWLPGEIAIIQPYNEAVAAEEFQVWKLAVRPDRTATLARDNGNGNIVFTKEIEYRDFPLDEITLYFANKMIDLPERLLSNAKPARRRARWHGLFCFTSHQPINIASETGSFASMGVHSLPVIDGKDTIW